MTPDKRVEEIIEEFRKNYPMKANETEFSITVYNFAMPENLITFLTTTLTQYHQDIISDVVNKIEKHEFTIDIKEYLSKVKAWTGGYDKPFEDGCAQAKKDIIKTLTK